jgi:hypothetical protein
MKTLSLFILLCYFTIDTTQNFVPDTSINQIKLVDASSTRLKLKADTSKIEQAFAMVDSALPEVSALNKSGSQKMKMIFHPGSSKYEFSAFKETWFYAIRDQKSPLLKKYNQWKYFAAYKFNESDELVEFQFGFEYP